MASTLDESSILARMKTSPRKVSRMLLVILSSVFLLLAVAAPASAADSLWVRIDDGLYHAQFVGVPPSTVGDSRIDVIRIDPRLYAIEVKMVSETKDNPLTAREWTEKYNLLAATNAGMFQQDFRTHVGYMRQSGHVNSATNTTAYLSAAAFDPVDTTKPAFRIFDLDVTSLDEVREQYRTVIQNLRLIKHPGHNTWSQQDKLWSEAALGEDKQGNILLIFSRSPYSMYELNHILLKLPIDLVAAQHLEGGPEASLYLSHNGHAIERTGSFETSFMPSDDNDQFWPLPNVIGIRKMGNDSNDTPPGDN